MASPIFISNPSEAFSIWLVLRGIKLGILSSLRSLQNPAFLSTTLLSTAVKLSLLLYISLNGPVLLTSLFVNIINYLRIWNFNSLSVLTNFEYVIQHVFNLNIFLISLSSFIDPTLDNLFLQSLKFVDEFNSTNYFHNINRLTNNNDQDIGLNPNLTIVQKYQMLFKNSKYFKNFLNRYFKFYLFNLTIYSLIQFSSLNYKISTIMLNFISFQTFQDKLGTLFSIFLIASLNFLFPLDYTFLVLTTFYSTSNLTIDLLNPYFQRFNYSTIEKNQWLNSRQGVLFGFGLVNYLLISYFPQLIVVWYVLAQLNMAYLLTKMTDSPPSTTSKSIRWSSTQLVWDKSTSSSFWKNDSFMNISISS